jgi:phospholipid/cholesterol/gamma-HCH transport system substrate-binding protein
MAAGMKSSALETIVGAAVVAVAVLFFMFAYRTAGYGTAAGGYHVLAQFDNIDGIAVGTDVRVAGIKVGTVVGQTLDPKSYQAKIDMLVQPQYQLSDDTAAKITSEGLLGSKFVSLEPGGSDTKLSDGGEISYTQGAVDIWSLISQAMFSSKGGNRSGDGGAPAPTQPDANAPAPAQPDANAQAPAQPDANTQAPTQPDGDAAPPSDQPSDGSAPAAPDTTGNSTQPKQ